MATQTDLSAKPRTPLSRERVLRAALALADVEGIGSLTMRRLGQELLGDSVGDHLEVGRRHRV
jgi:hypothetical protein